MGTCEQGSQVPQEILASLMKRVLENASLHHSMPWHTYIIECNDGKFYTGITTDLERRIKAHNSGNGCRFTKYRTPVTLLHSEEAPTRSCALKREAEIKRLTRKEKEKLIGNRQ